MAKPKIGKGLVFLLFIFLLALSPLLSACTGEQGPPGERGVAGEPGAPGTSVGTISGTIANSAGAGIEKATVVTSPATATATTDAAGKYQIADVAIGVYAVTASASGYNVGYKASVSVAGGKTATVNLALADEAPFPLGGVRAVGFRTGDTDTYPDDELWLTTHYSLQDNFTHNEKIIVTSGLPNVGVGQYVYLEGKEHDADESALSGWAWTVVDPDEADVSVENADTRTPRFLADKKGKYEVTVSATNADGVQASSSFEVFAGTYIGAAACETCHSGSVMEDKVSGWLRTGHATKLEIAYGSYTPERDYCIGCHTTGYNQTDNAQGFDDMAKQVGWDPATESLTGWLKENNWTIDQIMESPMGKLANVQCESCHGPGLIHEGVKLAAESATIFNPGVCSQCHPQEAQWRYSGHSNTGAKEMHMAEGTSCVECHTGQGFVQVKIRGEAPVFPSAATPDKPATLAEPGEQPPVACAACHDPHAFTEPFEHGAGYASYQLRLAGDVTMPSGVTVDAKESAVCVSCHANKRDTQYKANYLAGTKTRGAHDNTQADIFYGVNAAAFTFNQTLASSPHPSVVEEGCIECHMAANPVLPADTAVDGKEVVSSHGQIVLNTVGGHTWSMEADWQGQEVQNTGACNIEGCHASMPLTTFNRPASADFDGDGSIEGVQDEVQGLLDQLAPALPQKAGSVLVSGNELKDLTELQRQALWNYWLLNNDGSLGVHNTMFAVNLLQLTIKELTGQEVGAAPQAPPAIPHTLEGRSDCVMCHSVGGSGVGQAGGLGLPASHEGRTSETCTSCHTQG